MQVKKQNIAKMNQHIAQDKIKIQINNNDDRERRNSYLCWPVVPMIHLFTAYNALRKRQLSYPTHRGKDVHMAKLSSEVEQNIQHSLDECDSRTSTVSWEKWDSTGA